MKTLKVLVACEYSGTVRDAFAALGHDATSCDLLPTEKRGTPAMYAFGCIGQPMVSPERERAGRSAGICAQAFGGTHSAHSTRKPGFSHFHENTQAYAGDTAVAVWAR